eukprot:gene3401-biopygen18736
MVCRRLRRRSFSPDVDAFPLNNSPDPSPGIPPAPNFGWPSLKTPHCRGELGISLWKVVRFSHSTHFAKKNVLPRRPALWRLPPPRAGRTRSAAGQAHPGGLGHASTPWSGEPQRRHFWSGRFFVLLGLPCPVAADGVSPILGPWRLGGAAGPRGSVGARFRRRWRIMGRGVPDLCQYSLFGEIGIRSLQTGAGASSARHEP